MVTTLVDIQSKQLCKEIYWSLFAYTDLSFCRQWELCPILWRRPSSYAHVHIQYCRRTLALTDEAFACLCVRSEVKSQSAGGRVGCLHRCTTGWLMKPRPEAYAGQTRRGDWPESLTPIGRYQTCNSDRMPKYEALAELKEMAPPVHADGAIFH
jgi:hypothetical protein